MGLMDKLFGNKNTPAPTATVAPTAPIAQVPAATSPVAGASKLSLGKIDLGKQSGKISLAKDTIVTIDNGVITARCTWSSKTDYDLYALVLMKDGTTKVVSTFGSDAQRTPTDSILNGAVKHLGDVKSGSGKDVGEETIEIRFTPEIEAIVPVAYSAQSNGTGSFSKYNVSCGISNGAGTEVTIEADNANTNNNVYSVAIGLIRNTANGVQIESLRSYSAAGSENRPAFVNGVLVMDKGAKNLYKK